MLPEFVKRTRGGVVLYPVSLHLRIGVSYQSSYQGKVPSRTAKNLLVFFFFFLLSTARPWVGQRRRVIFEGVTWLFLRRQSRLFPRL